MKKVKQIALVSAIGLCAASFNTFAKVSHIFRFSTDNISANVRYNFSCQQENSGDGLIFFGEGEYAAKAPEFTVHMDGRISLLDVEYPDVNIPNDCYITSFVNGIRVITVGQDGTHLIGRLIDINPDPIGDPIENMNLKSMGFYSNDKKLFKMFPPIGAGVNSIFNHEQTISVGSKDYNLVTTRFLPDNNGDFIYGFRITPPPVSPDSPPEK